MDCENCQKILENVQPMIEYIKNCRDRFAREAEHHKRLRGYLPHDAGRDVFIRGEIATYSKSVEECDKLLECWQNTP